MLFASISPDVGFCKPVEGDFSIGPNFVGHEFSPALKASLAREQDPWRWTRLLFYCCFCCHPSRLSHAKTKKLVQKF